MRSKAKKRAKKAEKKAEKRERFVAYYRVSTGKQNQEMPAQKTAVKRFLQGRKLEKSFTEIESGKSAANRPAIREALQYCYDNKATLVVAKLDRLSRDLEFIGWLQNTDIKFVCCDMPQATRETIGLMAVMARWEREQISKRTKEALAEKKKQGVKLGYHRREVKAGVKRYWREYKKRKKAWQKAQEKEPDKAPVHEQVIRLSRVHQSDLIVIPAIKVMRGQHKTFKEIADALNEQGIPSRFGGRWHKTSVLRVADRHDLE